MHIQAGALVAGKPAWYDEVPIYGGHMNISLRPEVQEYVQSKVKSGEFPSEEAVVNALLSQARAREELAADDISELRNELDIGIAQANTNDFVEFNANDVIADRQGARKKVSGWG